MATRAYIYDDKFCKNVRCKKRFEAKCWNAKFCSPKCRLQYHRDIKASEKLADKILLDMFRLQNLSCASESVSTRLKRIEKIASSLADQWEYVRPLEEFSSR